VPSAPGKIAIIRSSAFTSSGDSSSHPGGTPAPDRPSPGSAGVGFNFVTDDRGFVTEPGLAGGGRP